MLCTTGTPFKQWKVIGSLHPRDCWVLVSQSPLRKIKGCHHQFPVAFPCSLIHFFAYVRNELHLELELSFLVFVITVTI